MGNGVGLDTAFNQDEPQQNINTHAKQDKQAEGLEDERKEEERKDKKKLNLERIYDAKIGETVSYNATTGTIVRKDGSYVTIYNEGNNAFDQVHAGQTSISTDTIGSGITAQLWDQMRQEQRVASLNKAHVEEPLHFISRKWSELPMNLKDVLKLKPTRNTTSSPTRNQQPLGGSDDSGSPYKKPKFNEYDPEHNDLEWSGQGPGNQINSNEDKNKNILKFNPDSEPGKKMPGTASNKPTKQTMTPQGRNVLIGNTGNKLNTGRSSTTTGTHVPVKVGGKTYMVTERQRDTWHKNTTEGQRGDKKFVTQYGDKLSGKKTGVKQDSTYKPGPKATEKPAVGSNTGTTFGQSKGPGHDGKGSVTPATPTVTTKKPGGSAGAATNSVKPAGTKNLTGSTSGTTAGSTAAAAASRRSTSSPTPPRQSEGVTFATGLDKANSYSDLATAIYRIRNNINKVTGAKIPHEKFGDLPVGKPDGKVGGTKIVTPEGEKTLKNPADSYGFVSEKKSDVEHGAYGGVVTDTEFDAPEDYEEKRPKVDGKEFDHNHQQKTPRDPKEDGKEVMVGYHNKEGESVSTGTPGTFNAKYDPDEDGYKEKKRKIGVLPKHPQNMSEDEAYADCTINNEFETQMTPHSSRQAAATLSTSEKARETEIVNKNNTRYGPRTATKEEMYRYLNK
jgi:hypothetical protein